jgi:hypothetical protein
MRDLVFGTTSSTLEVGVVQGDVEEPKRKGRSKAPTTARMHRRTRDALEAERQKLEAERRELESQRVAFKAQQDKWAAEAEKAKAVLVQDVEEREGALAAKVAGFEQQVKEAEERYRDPSNIVQLNVRSSLPSLIPPLTDSPGWRDAS